MIKMEFKILGLTLLSAFVLSSCGKNNNAYQTDYRYEEQREYRGTGYEHGRPQAGYDYVIDSLIPSLEAQYGHQVYVDEDLIYNGHHIPRRAQPYTWREIYQSHMTPIFRGCVDRCDPRRNTGIHVGAEINYKNVHVGIEIHKNNRDYRYLRCNGARVAFVDVLEVFYLNMNHYYGHVMPTYYQEPFYGSYYDYAPQYEYAPDYSGSQWGFWFDFASYR